MRGTVIRFDIEHLPKPCGRTEKTLWLCWSGRGQVNLERWFRPYLLRFDIEHAFRWTLGWTTPQLCASQAEPWTLLVFAAYTQLRLARGLAADLRLPWEQLCTPQHPCCVLRGFQHTGHAAEIASAWPRKAERNPKTRENPPSGCHEG